MATFTKNHIKNTFIEMLEERPLTQITVKDLVSRCGINRNSFYYHYEDLPALINEIVIEEADRIIEAYPKINSMETALYAVIDFASSKRRAILHIFNSVNRDIFESGLWKVCTYAVTLYGASFTEHRVIPEKNLQLLTHYYRCACFGFAIDWLKNGMNEEIREYIPRFCRLHDGVIEKMLTNAEE